MSKERNIINMSFIKITKISNCQLLKKTTCFDHWVSLGSEGRPLNWRSVVWFLDPCSLRVAVSLGKILNSKLLLVSLVLVCECVWMLSLLMRRSGLCLQCVNVCVNADFEWSDYINTVHPQCSHLVFIRAPGNEQHDFITYQMIESASIEIITE